MRAADMHMIEEEAEVLRLMRLEDVGAAQLYPAFDRLKAANVILSAPGGAILAEAYR